MKVFVKVVDNEPRKRTARDVVSQAEDKFQAEFFVKHAQPGEFQVIDGQVIFRER